GRPPAIDRVVWKPIPDDFPRIVALEKGEADIITNVPPDRLKALAESQSTKIVSTAATRTVTFWINATQPPLSDTRVRQALHLALDVDGLVKSLYAGMGRPMSGGLADTDFGYNPALKPYPYDPARAKRLLADAGRAGGVDVTLYAGSGTMVNDKFLLEAIADMWAKVGIRAKVEMMEMGARQRMNNERTLPPNSLLLINPQSTLLDADGSLWRLFHPNGFGGKYWPGNQPGQRFHEPARHVDRRRVLEVRPHDLNAHRQPVTREADGRGRRREAREGGEGDPEEQVEVLARALRGCQPAVEDPRAVVVWKGGHEGR